MPDQLVAGFTRMMNDHGGVMTWDVPILDDGKIPGSFLRQLRRIRARKK